MSPSSTQSTQTLAASWQRNGTIDLINKELPPIAPGQVLVKVAASGLCGTDLHICRGETPHAAQKVIIGHELSGYIHAIGENTVTGLKVGDLVAVDPNIHCHACTYCRNAKPHLCQAPQAIGVTTDGGMSQYVNVPVSAAYKVPEGVSAEVASLAEPLSCVVHAVDMGNITSGSHVIVLGAGPIGTMTVALAVSSGARVTVVDPHESRRKVAKETFGAAVTLTPAEAKDIKESFDVVFECVGKPEAMQQAVDMAKAGGTIVWVGVAKTEDRVSISPFEVYRRELTIKSSYTNHFSMERALNLLANDQIDWSQLISHTYSLEQFDTAWKVFQSKTGMKICVKP
ncbi:chaperonin 10-like protein [Umbelopsis sp. AD052]|nr:chaperonin 10-like protein [Umbelopsis sp. AD052]